MMRVSLAARRGSIPIAPMHEYRFRFAGGANPGYYDSWGGPNITPVGPGTLLDGGYRFERNSVTPQGLQLDGALLAGAGAAYTIAMSLTLNRPLPINAALPNQNSYAKLIDFKGLTSDVGLYQHDSSGINFYTQFNEAGAPEELGHAGREGSIRPGRRHDIVLTRGAASKRICVYIDGGIQTTFVDTMDEAVFDAGGPLIRRITFFLDDVITTPNLELPDGVCNHIMIWNTELPPNQVPLIALAGNGVDGEIFGMQGTGGGSAGVPKP